MWPAEGLKFLMNNLLMNVWTVRSEALRSPNSLSENLMFEPIPYSAVQKIGLIHAGLFRSLSLLLSHPNYLKTLVLITFERC